MSELKDAIPTLAEAEFAWTPQQMPLPAVGSDAVALSREVLTVFVNWAHDARTGYTKASLGIRSEGDPDGLISTSTKPLIAALAFGPALLSGVDADTDRRRRRARASPRCSRRWRSRRSTSAADRLSATAPRRPLTSATFETEMRSISDPGPDMQVRVVTDYVCTLHINGGVLGVKTVADQPMKIRYKRVGIEYDTSKEGWERFGLVYDSTVDGDRGSRPLADRRRARKPAAHRRGGDGARLGLDRGPHRGGARPRRHRDHRGDHPADLPRRAAAARLRAARLRPQGRHRRACSRARAVCASRTAASSAPASRPTSSPWASASRRRWRSPRWGRRPIPWIFLSLFLGVQFATPLPLAQSGLAIYGFKGMFAMNGARTALPNPDPVARARLVGHAARSRSTTRNRGQFALGVGVWWAPCPTRASA